MTHKPPLSKAWTRFAMAELAAMRAYNELASAKANAQQSPNEKAYQLVDEARAKLEKAEKRARIAHEIVRKAYNCSPSGDIDEWIASVQTPGMTANMYRHALWELAGEIAAYAGFPSATDAMAAAGVDSKTKPFAEFTMEELREAEDKLLDYRAKEMLP